MDKPRLSWAELILNYESTFAVYLWLWVRLVLKINANKTVNSATEFLARFGLILKTLVYFS